MKYRVIVLFFNLITFNLFKNCKQYMLVLENIRKYSLGNRT